MNGCSRAKRILVVVVFLFLHGLSLAAAPQVTARLDVLSTPTLGGCGQVIWAGISDVSAPGELTFIVQRPGAAEKVTKIALGLNKDELTERIFAFDTPVDGEYLIKIRLEFNIAMDQIQDWTRTVVVLKNDPAKPAQAIIPLTMDGPLVTSTISAPGEVKIFSINLAAGGRCMVECVRGRLADPEVAYRTNTIFDWNYQRYWILQGGRFLNFQFTANDNCQL